MKGYRELSRAALDGRRGDVPALLAAMGVSTASGGPVSEELVAPVLDLASRLVALAGVSRCERTFSSLVL